MDLKSWNELRHGYLFFFIGWRTSNQNVAFLTLTEISNGPQNFGKSFRKSNPSFSEGCFVKWRTLFPILNGTGSRILFVYVEVIMLCF